MPIVSRQLRDCSSPAQRVSRPHRRARSIAAARADAGRVARSRSRKKATAARCDISSCNPTWQESALAYPRVLCFRMWASSALCRNPKPKIHLLFTSCCHSVGMIPNDFRGKSLSRARAGERKRGRAGAGRRRKVAALVPSARKGEGARSRSEVAARIPPACSQEGKPPAPLGSGLGRSGMAKVVAG